MVSINFMEIQMGGGVFELGNPGGRGGGWKNRAFRRRGVERFFLE